MKQDQKPDQTSSDTKPRNIKVKKSPVSRTRIQVLTKPTAAFTQALAHEIVKNLSSFGQLTTAPFRKAAETKRKQKAEKDALGEFPMLVDTSVLIDGRMVPIVNSGFIAGTLLIPQFVLGEVQHIADSQDLIRRTKGRRGLDVAAKLRNQKVNDRVRTKIIGDDPPEVKEVDHKLIALAKKWKIRILTLDFNLAQLARAQGIKVLNINDLAQALKIALVPGEEIKIRISHIGKEREQGVGYLDDGTMVVVDNTKDKVGNEVVAVLTKIHQTPAGQLFFAKTR
ncbi:hypothetical protein A2154_04410 [Candidatus Gottesmanbacteria bacterium RBG_16_43_7]|uniref:TRAM domain-containing protein n=1 Tax=Candidatus Gottesmanbacteria bacterium RBG_16_43_7 TaxID=1798373 RepID=A0A1F5ZCG1_9BACT|nr:MAG: hypothetical protein A2154_04410 [Candidatus Gottesmanbacteria bacterium RBG_16_43_7]